MQDTIFEGFRENPSVGHIYNDWVDSHLEHWKEWDTIAHRFGLSPEDDYFLIPRGRCQVHLKTGRGRILHGPNITETQLKHIAQWYQFVEFDALYDDHYRISADASDFD